MLDLCLFIQEKLLKNGYSELIEVQNDLASALVFDDYFDDDFCIDLYTKVTFLDKFLYIKLRELKGEIVWELQEECYNNQNLKKEEIKEDHVVERAFDRNLNQLTGNKNRSYFFNDE